MYHILLNENIDDQVNKINDEPEISIIVDKIDSFYPLIKSLKKKFNGNNNISITCLPYEAVDKLHISNKNKYSICFNKKTIKIFINDYQIDTTKENIYTQKIVLNNSFVMDIFRLFDNVKRYEWSNDEVCDFHKYRSSAMYGPMSGYYERVKQNIIKIVSCGGCCDYSGGETYFDINKNKGLYHSCNCFLNIKEVNKILNKKEPLFKKIDKLNHPHIK
jgi:hypothetical protein